MGVTLFDRFHPQANYLRSIIYERRTQQADAGNDDMLQLTGSNPGKNIYTICGERPRASVRRADISSIMAYPEIRV